MVHTYKSEYQNYYVPKIVPQLEHLIWIKSSINKIQVIINGYEQI